MQINGSMEVSQERAINTGYNGINYICDGWKQYFVAPIVLNSLVGVLGAGVPSGNYIEASVATAQPTLVAGDLAVVYQPIEGYRVSRLAFGAGAAQSITVSFWTAHHRAGLYCGAVQNGPNDRSYVFTYTQSVADVWQFNTVTIPGDTTGTWARDNTTGLAIGLTVAAGSTWQASSANTWLAGNFKTVAGAINGAAATSDRFRITGVVVLPGIEAPSAARSPLIMRPFDQELITCQRYFYFALAGLQTTATNAFFYSVSYSHPVAMRADPTVTLGGNFALNNFNTPFAEAPNIYGFQATAQASASAAGTWRSFFKVDARL
jgi:hypothetical protein